MWSKYFSEWSVLSGEGSQAGPVNSAEPQRREKGRLPEGREMMEYIRMNGAIEVGARR